MTQHYEGFVAPKFTKSHMPLSPTAPVLHGVTGQGEPYGVAGSGGLGLDAATDVVEMVVVLADDLTAYDILGALQMVVGTYDTRLGGIEQGMQRIGIEGARVV